MESPRSALGEFGRQASPPVGLALTATGGRPVFHKLATAKWTHYPARNRTDEQLLDAVAFTSRCSPLKRRAGRQLPASETAAALGPRGSEVLIKQFESIGGAINRFSVVEVNRAVVPGCLYPSHSRKGVGVVCMARDGKTRSAPLNGQRADSLRRHAAAFWCRGRR